MKLLIKQLKKIWWRVKSIWAMGRYGNPAAKMKIVGVTGTNGKTTTATLLYTIATELGYKAGLVSTVENIVAGEKRGATHTTPDSITLTKLFKEMAGRGCEYVFMEVSSHAIDQNRVWGINFTGAIFTNLTHDHLDYHKNLDNYFLAKKKLFDRLDRHAFALSNADDTHGRVILGDSSANKFFYGYDGKEEDVEFYGEIINKNFLGLDLKFNNIQIHSKLLGKFNAYNLLAVWSASSLLGFDMPRVNKILENIAPPNGRFEHFKTPNGALVIIDYAHSPDSLEKVLLAANEVKGEGKKLISLFGCGGDRDSFKRPVMGKIGATLSDIAIFTSDNPRSEDPQKIIEAMKADLTPDLLQKVKTIPDRREAMKEAVKLAQAGDIILSAGKGHEDYQEIKGVKHHFYDKEEFEKLFQQK
jgi:UDP-N-acetylmuramoyl-L-alanyl-D-glutamate--2,6-diaminopimelate ligase